MLRVLTAKQQKALTALLNNRTQEEAAKAAGIAPRTLRNYLSDTDFKQEYIKRCSEMVSDATRQAQQGLCPSINALRAIVDDAEQPPTARIQAARILIDTSVKLTEIYDLQARIEALEQGLDDDTGN